MKIGIIDKHPMLRKGLSIFLEEYFNNVKIFQAGTIDHYNELAEKETTLIILGIGQSSQADNLFLIGKVKMLYPRAKLILYDEAHISVVTPEYLVEGVYGYINKQAELNDLVKCIRMVIAGQRYICDPLISVLIDRVRKKSNIIPRESISLSKKQYEIATYLIQGMKTSDIATTLGKKVSTISTVKSTILAKYNVDNVLKLRDIFSLTS